MHFPEIPVFFRFSNCVQFAPFIEFKTIFRITAKKLAPNMYHTSETRNLQFDLSLASRPLGCATFNFFNFFTFAPLFWCFICAD